MEKLSDQIEKAAEAIRRGNLVVMPTETVYGLAADAFNTQAISKIFSAKRRPADDPLIVHIADVEQLHQIAKEIASDAHVLMKTFWPGPLTLVFPKSLAVPDITTANLDTVAVRMPNHPVALALIRAAGTPVAAPSANIFGRTSPTVADHLDPAILSQVESVLDAGPCQVGIESTVLDLSSGEPLLLRPGVISKQEIEQALGKPIKDGAGRTKRSPGLYKRHYAPRAKLHLVSLLGDRPGLTFSRSTNSSQIRMPTDPKAYARQLYIALHHLDKMGLDTIYAEYPPEDSSWDAVRDRLRRAAAS